MGFGVIDKVLRTGLRGSFRGSRIVDGSSALVSSVRKENVEPVNDGLESKVFGKGSITGRLLLLGSPLRQPSK